MGDLYLADKLIDTYANGLLERLPDPEVVVLGCTHYPLVKNLFTKHLGNQTKILDHPDIVCESLKDYISRHPDKIGDQNKSYFLTSGDPKNIEGKALQLSGIKVSFNSII